MLFRLRLSVIIFVLSVGLFAAAISSELGMFRDVNGCEQKTHLTCTRSASTELRVAVHGDSRSDLLSLSLTHVLTLH